MTFSSIGDVGANIVQLARIRMRLISTHFKNRRVSHDATVCSLFRVVRREEPFNASRGMVKCTHDRFQTRDYVSRATVHDNGVHSRLIWS